MVYIRGIREICGQLNTPVILHSICSMALCEPAATELESKNTHGVSDLLRSLFTDLFFDLYFDFRLIVPWQDKRDFRRILWEENRESMDGSCGLPAVSLWDDVSAPMLHLWCKGAALLVQGCCTFTGTIIRKSLQWLFCHIAMIYYRYIYAALSVSLCCTFGTRMLCFSGTVFSICLQAISR